MVSGSLIKETQEFLKSKYPELLLESFTDDDSREILKRILKEEYKDILPSEKINLLIQEIVGLGIIEDILKTDGVTDISFNGTDLIVNTNDRKFIYNEKYIDESYIEKTIQKFANAAGKEFTPKTPILDATFKNLRLNAVHKSISPFGTTMALRYSRPKLALNTNNFSEFAPDYVLNLFEVMVRTRSNIVISGETGSGKTELQKLLAGFIPFNEKIVLIEDTIDSHLKKLYENKDIHSWVTSSKISFTDLIKASLRNNPAWIILSETRGKEAYEMLQAILSGHTMITTLHAVDCRAIPKRFINMMKIGYQIDEKSVLEDIYNYFRFGVHIEKTEINGKVIRYLSEIVEYMPNQTALTVFKQVRKGNVITSYKGEYSKFFQDQIDKYGMEFRWEK